MGVRVGLKPLSWPLWVRSRPSPVGRSLSGTGHTGLLHPAGLAALGLSPHAGGPHSPWPIPAVSAPIPSCR